MILFFFFNDTATTEIYTLSLHDALPILTATLLDHWDDGSLDEELSKYEHIVFSELAVMDKLVHGCYESLDRKSTRLNSSHANISYAVFCLKKKLNLSPATYFYATITSDS